MGYGKNQCPSCREVIIGINKDRSLASTVEIYLGGNPSLRLSPDDILEKERIYTIGQRVSNPKNLDLSDLLTSALPRPEFLPASTERVIEHKYSACVDVLSGVEDESMSDGVFLSLLGSNFLESARGTGL
jgi:hypothetical protein